MSFLLDSTIGLVVIYLGLKFTQVLVRKYSCDSLKFGEYGEYGLEGHMLPTFK